MRQFVLAFALILLTQKARYWLNGSPSSVNETMVNEWLQRHLGWQDQADPSPLSGQASGYTGLSTGPSRRSTELPMRRVFLEQLKLERFVSPEAEITVHCSKGTYIRSLAEQLGQDLCVGAHLSALRRLRCGSRFVIEEPKLRATGSGSSPMDGFFQSAERFSRIVPASGRSRNVFDKDKPSR